MSSRETELGTLVIVVLKARNLNDKHSFYKQDVFAQVSLNGVTKQTHVDVKGGQHPEWDAEIRFPVLKQSQDKHRKLEVACFAKESRSDDILGSGTVDITDTLRTREFDEWVPLSIDGVVRGDLYLEMTFFSNTPLPTTSSAPPSNDLMRRPSHLAPSERLSRPQGPTPSAVLQNLLSDDTRKPQELWSNAKRSSPDRRSASSSLPPSPSPYTKQSDLPPLPPPEGGAPAAAPAFLPPTLLPGGGRPRPRQNQTPHVTPHLPSSLKSGPEKRIVSHPITLPQSDRHPLPPPTPYNAQYTPDSSAFPTSNAPAPVNYTQFSNIHPAPIHSYSPQPDTIAPLWTTGKNISDTAGPLSFPVPSVTPVQGGVIYGTGQLAPEPHSTPFQPPRRNELLDPYLQVRYQTPLPLPPNASGTSHDPKASPPRQNPDRVSFETRRRMEEAARLKEQKEQEERDLALAMQLDRELNLEQTSSPPASHGSNPNMPGGW